MIPDSGVIERIEGLPAMPGVGLLKGVSFIDRAAALAILHADSPASVWEAAAAERRVARDNAVTPLRKDAVVSSAEPLRCGGCGGPHQFDTSVPSPSWNRVIRAAGLSEFLCTTCIVLAFVKAGESFEAELYGDAVNRPDRTVPVIRVQVDDRPIDQTYGDLEYRLRAAAEPRQSLDGLAEAWEEAEAALPEGWQVSRLDYNRLRDSWTAMAEYQRDAGSVAATGPTPAAALRSLAAKLREGTTT